MTTAELAASRGVRHQTMAVTVKELADAGHLSAGADPEDARKKILSLTASGKSALDADREHRVGLLAQAMNEVLNDDERKVMAQALALIDRVGRAVNRMTAT